MPLSGELIVGPLTQCVFCRHRDTTGPLQVCTAFPSVIPDEILRNAYDHRRPWLDADGRPGDVGIRGDVSITFAPREDLSAADLAPLYRHLDQQPPNRQPLTPEEAAARDRVERYLGVRLSGPET